VARVDDGDVQKRREHLAPPQPPLVPLDGQRPLDAHGPRQFPQGAAAGVAEHPAGERKQWQHGGPRRARAGSRATVPKIPNPKHQIPTRRLSGWDLVLGIWDLRFGIYPTYDPASSAGSVGVTVFLTTFVTALRTVTCPPMDVIRSSRPSWSMSTMATRTAVGDLASRATNV